MFLPPVSLNQQNILNELDNYNVVVDSVAGSGKTTCSLYIAKYNINLKLLLLTYNAKLKLETKKKIKDYNINNIDVYSYHSFCVNNYDSNCFTDKEINLMLSKNSPIINNINYDIIILDETQDMNELYYELFCKIYKDNLKKAKLCIFGDIKQSIFTFNNADERYIVYADTIFNFNNLQWKHCKLNESFRITYEMSLFINNCLLNDDRLISNKITNNKPRYILCNCFASDAKTLDEIKFYLNKGYKYDEIFILAPSVKNLNMPIRLLENKIKKELPNIQVYVPSSDEEKLDEDVLNNKLVFSTFHQVKGLERKVVIIFNFDNSYFKYYDKYKDVYKCPNELYVATTRALERLTVIHNSSCNYLQFINKENLKLYCDIEIINNIELYNDYKLSNVKRISVTNLVKHLPYNIIDTCINLIEQIPIVKSNKLIHIRTKSKQPNGYENVSDITGIAIPCYLELKTKGQINILKHLKKENDTKFKIANLKVRDLLYIANCWHHKQNGFLFRLCQIKYYDWLSENTLSKCFERMLKLKISKDAEYEIYREVKLNNGVLISGYIDCVDNYNLYEFKCTQTLEDTHILQLALYMYLHEMNKQNIILSKEELLSFTVDNDTSLYVEGLKDIIKLNKIPSNYFINNILSNECIQLKCSIDNLQKIVNILIDYKYNNIHTTSNEVFINKNLLIRCRYN